MTAPEPQIDHVLVNVNDALDEAAARYSQLGFTLTPRGHHSVGSSNHLAIFQDDYFELLGYEPRNAERAAGQWGDITGFAGLIFKTADAAELYSRLQAASIATLTAGPRALSRPVDLPDGTSRDASFSTLHLDPALTPSGRIFFCQHITPELVWRKEWQEHPNGVTGMAGVVFASTDPARSISLLERIYGSSRTSTIDGGLRFQLKNADLDYLTPEAAIAKYGPDLHLSPDGSDRKVALLLKTSSVGKAKGTLQSNGIAFSTGASGELLVPASIALGPVLSFST